jgi:hypothetical protein
VDEDAVQIAGRQLDFGAEEGDGDDAMDTLGGRNTDGSLAEEGSASVLLSPSSKAAAAPADADAGAGDDNDVTAAGDAKQQPQQGAMDMAALMAQLLPAQDFFVEVAAPGGPAIASAVVRAADGVAEEDDDELVAGVAAMRLAAVAEAEDEPASAVKAAAPAAAQSPEQHEFAADYADFEYEDAGAATP